MKTIKSLKEITTLEVGDVVVFGDLKYSVRKGVDYFLHCWTDRNDKIFKVLNINKRNFIENLGIDAKHSFDFPETKSLEALTAIVSALFKEYEKQNQFPKTWEEFCDKYPVSNNEVVLSHNSVILTFDELPNSFTERDPDVDRNFCTSLKEAEAFLALMQLRQLRKAYVKDWEPDWTSDIGSKYCIEVNNNELLIHSWYYKSHTLSFPSRELAEHFLTNFKDLLEIAKPLL